MNTAAAAGFQQARQRQRRSMSPASGSRAEEHYPALHSEIHLQMLRVSRVAGRESPAPSKSTVHEMPLCPQRYSCSCQLFCPPLFTAAGAPALRRIQRLRLWLWRCRITPLPLSALTWCGPLHLPACLTACRRGTRGKKPQARRAVRNALRSVDSSCTRRKSRRAANSAASSGVQGPGTRGERASWNRRTRERRPLHCPLVSQYSTVYTY